MRIIIFLALAAFTGVGCSAEKYVPQEASATTVVATASDSISTEFELPPPMHMFFSSVESPPNDPAQEAKDRAWESAAARLSEIFRHCGYSPPLRVDPPDRELTYLTWGQDYIYVWMTPGAFRQYSMSELRRLQAGTEKIEQVAACLRELEY